MTPERTRVYAAGAVLFILVWLAYADTLRAPFIFDDEPGIVMNTSIHRFRDAWHAPAGSGADGRPVVNYSLALNHALGGNRPVGYHAFNIFVHAGAALLLFGLVRRTLVRAAVAGAEPVAALGAALWALHPLQTESVSCVIQRTESLMGLFYLATLYAFARSVDAPKNPAWRAASVAFCLLGMATKEVMVSAPLLVLLYDRTFVAGSFAAAWRERRGYYLALAATWALLAWLVIGAGGNRGGTAGWHTGIPVWNYLLTQCWALVRYLWLSVVPYPLVLDYGSPAVAGLSEVFGEALLIPALVAGTCWALVRRPRLGFCGFWFFAILAPSSSIVPLVTQTVAEHRMYLPLAALAVPAVLGLHAWAGRRGRWLGAALVLVYGLVTVARNHDYRTPSAVWADSAKHSPDPERSRYYLGVALARESRLAEAARAYASALRLKPGHAEAHNNLGNTLARLGRGDEAVDSYRAALRLRPGFAEARANLTNLLLRRGVELWTNGRQVEAVALMDEAVRTNPDDPAAHNTLGEAFQQSGRVSEARAEFEAALRVQPGFAPARANLERLH